MAAPLMKLFVTAGQRQLALLGSRLEPALVKLFVEKPVLVIRDLATEVKQLGNHIQIVCKAFRAFAREEVRSGSVRRYPKTSRLRHGLSVTDMVVIRSLLQDVDVPGMGDDDTALDGLFALTGSAATSRASSPGSTIGYENDGWPVFPDIECPSTAKRDPDPTSDPACAQG